MKLLQKLTLALVFVSCAVLVGNGYFRVKREVGALQDDRVRVHDVVASSLAGAVAALWTSDGKARALAILDAANARDLNIHVQLVEKEMPASFDEAARAEVAQGRPVTRIVHSANVDERVTLDEVRVANARIGWIEITEPLAAEERAIHGIVSDTIRATLVLALVTGALSVVLGLWFVGRPVRALTEKARRIGRGDFTGPVLLRQKDELRELAEEMNAMCERLARETAARASAMEQLRHADRLTTVGKLASGVAHELGTPLNVVSARAQMIQSGDADATEAKDYARIIVESCAKMTRIIRQLLAFARPSPAQKAPLEIAKLAAETLELLRPLAQKGRVVLELQPVGAERLVASADAGQIQQVITNLVMNAIQATSDGGGTVRARVDRVRAKNQIRSPRARASGSRFPSRTRAKGSRSNISRTFSSHFSRQKT